jgi:hypothetical protein
VVKRKGNKPSRSEEEVAPLTKSTNEDHPKFDFSTLQNGFGIEELDKQAKLALLERLVKLSTFTWFTLVSNGKHAWGTEYLDLNLIKPSTLLFPNEPKVCVLRYTGDNKPIVGRRVENIFEIYWIEKNHGDVYHHG